MACPAATQTSKGSAVQEQRRGVAAHGHAGSWVRFAARAGLGPGGVQCGLVTGGSARLEHVLLHCTRHHVGCLVERPHLAFAARRSACVWVCVGMCGCCVFSGRQQERCVGAVACKASGPGADLSRQPSAPRFSCACERSLAPGMGTAPCKQQQQAAAAAGGVLQCSHLARSLNQKPRPASQTTCPTL